MDCGYTASFDLTGILFQPSSFSSKKSFFFKEKAPKKKLFFLANIDEEKPQNLMELVNKEHSNLDPFIIWAFCVIYLLNEQGMYGDKKNCRTNQGATK